MFKVNITETLQISCFYQERCCSNCNTALELYSLESASPEKVRVLPEDSIDSLQNSLEKLVVDWKHRIPTENMFYSEDDIDKNVVTNIMEKIEFISEEMELMQDFGVWNERCCSEMFLEICSKAPSF